MNIPRKKKVCKRCGIPSYIWARGLCKPCALSVKPMTPLRRSPIKIKVSAKQKERIVENKSYYRWAIGQNIIKNAGKCLCDECGEPINNPLGTRHGSAVCHIISSNANPALYHEPENHFILGRGPLFGECGCGEQFDNSVHRHKMKIAPIAEAIKIKLTHKYYTKKPSH